MSKKQMSKVLFFQNRVWKTTNRTWEKFDGLEKNQILLPLTLINFMAELIVKRICPHDEFCIILGDFQKGEKLYMFYNHHKESLNKQ